MRQRPDGTFTHSTEEWDAKWYWPEGTLVSFRDSRGVVTKANSVSAWIAFDAGSLAGTTRKVSVLALTRLQSTSGATMQALADATTREGLKGLKK